MKYEILLNILDQFRAEATSNNYTRYSIFETNPDRINNARSRAFIHLFMKVMFGILNFEERERSITDASYDGGIDGYYIHRDLKEIYLIQSKFRTTKHNFENKEIALEDILRMDVNRILEGEECDEDGNPYNGKIKQLQREVSNIDDVARYNYKIILLANLKNVPSTKLRQLTGGYAVEVFDYEKSYEKLVFPVISGTYFVASDISIPIDLSNKNAGSKISYTVTTRMSDCEITVLFAPTIEIAKIMYKYKNSILKYNPRSYLEFEGHAVNNAIRDTITSTHTNEFSLYNNGITLLSDETYINEKIGQKNKAQLIVKNPQIINGGQTSFTLSRIYEKHKDNPEYIFKDKEVLLKIITLINNSNHVSKLQLIDEISNATNKQTPVINADRFANDILHMNIQKKVFDRYGLLYERKRGEFADGLKDGYIQPKNIIERNLFLRLYYSANGMVRKGSQKRLFQKNEFQELDINNDESFDKFYVALHLFRYYVRNPEKMDKTKYNFKKLEKNTYAKIFAYVIMFFQNGVNDSITNLKRNYKIFENKWIQFIKYKIETTSEWTRFRVDKTTGEAKRIFSESAYCKSRVIESDIEKYFRN